MKDAAQARGLITAKLVSANYATRLLTPLRHSRGKVFYLSTTLIKHHADHSLRAPRRGRKRPLLCGGMCCLQHIPVIAL